jgi:PAS domain S-box-containing protein
MKEQISILIVEDERIIAIDIASTLRRLGYSVAAEASRGDEALAIIARKKPDLVLMDILLKGEMDGIECASIIDEKYKIPVVYLTAHQDNATIEKTKSTNPYGFISKPLDERDLNICIKNAMYRHDSEIKYQDIKEKYFRLTENARDMIYRYSLTDKRFEYINKSSADITGFSPEEFYKEPETGKKFINLNGFSSDKNLISISEAFSKRGSEYRITDKNGNSKWLFQKSVIIYDDSGAPAAIEGIVSDISQRKAYEEQITEANKQLHSLAGYIEKIREEERLAISREIHDQLGQDLTVMKVDLYLLSKKALDENALEDRIEISKEFQLIGDKINATIDKIRKISSDLRPDLLDRLGLIEAIEWHISEFEKRTGVQCNFNNNMPEVEFSEKISVQIFRILQELLTNVTRHSKANEVDIDLRLKDGNFEMLFKDNGIGITENQIAEKSSLGIMGLKERVYLQDGKIEISGSKRKGTSVRIAIPFEFKL